MKLYWVYSIDNEGHAKAYSAADIFEQWDIYHWLDRTNLKVYGETNKATEREVQQMLASFGATSMEIDAMPRLSSK